MRREPILRMDSAASAVLINRYLARVVQVKFNDKGSIFQNNEILWQNAFYQIQWKNIHGDLERLVGRAFKIDPNLAYSSLLLFLLLQNKLPEALHFIYFGSIAFDAAAESSASGEPASISWNHAVGSGDDRLININASGLSTPNDPTWAGNATTEIIATNPLQSHYYLAPATGTAACAISGGNIKVGGSISFSGVDQDDPIGASTSESGSSSPNDMTLTTEADNSFRVDILGTNRDDSTSPTASLDSGDERISTVTAHNQFRIGMYGYTNLQASAGSDTHAWTTSGFNRYYTAFEIKEATGGGGSEVKTANSLAKASVKTKNGLANASIDSWNGLQ